MSTTKKVAVIGLGNIGKGVARNLVKGNRSVILASRKLEDAQLLAQQLGSLASAAEIPEAIKQAEIIILSVMFGVIKEFLATYASALQDKIIIDPSNPVSVDENGVFKKIIGEKESAGQVNSLSLPKGTKLAKAWSTLGADTLVNAAFQKPDPAVLFYAADDASIDTDIEQLIRDNGFEPVKVGGLDQSIRIELFGDLNEFALGKTVTATEAKGKI